MISFVEAKRPNFDFVEEVLEASRKSNRWTNFGPVSRRLEAEVELLLELPDESRAVACASGTAALHALVGLYGFLAGRPLRWIVSALTFACQRQGPLSDSIVVDCSQDGLLDPEAVERFPETEYDGLIVTNLFGGAADVRRWMRLARQKDKLLIFDSAACFLSTYNGQPLGRFGDGEAFSFHHTKPCGVGEGGCIVVPREHEETARSLINFGRYAGIDTGPFSMNAKLSDIAAAYILDRLRSASAIRAAHRSQWRRILGIGQRLGFEVLGDPDPGFPAAAALLAPDVVGAAALDVSEVKLHKCYPPLATEAANARWIFDRSVCWPCHSELAALSTRAIEGILEILLRRARSAVADVHVHAPIRHYHGT